MLAKVLSSALLGIDAILIDVEVDIAQGLPQLATVGLPDGAVKESKDRVKAALKNSGYEFPNRKITVNLAPADVKKEGASFDLPMSVGILAATGVVRGDLLQRYLLQNARKYATIKGKAGRMRELPLGKWKWVAAALIGLWLFVGVIVPLSGIALRAFVTNWGYGAKLAEVLTLDHFRSVFDEPM